MREQGTDNTENRFSFKDISEATAVLGRHDEHLRVIIENFSGRITARGGEVVINGSAGEVVMIAKLFEELIYLYRLGNNITLQDVKYSIQMIKEEQADFLHKMFGEVIAVTSRGRQVRPKTRGQQFYVEAMRHNHITFGIGPAGTGKTYLAVAMAVFSLKNKEVERIILTRPAIEAGEKLGFLPGDLQDKVDPYLRPLYDALQDILGNDTFQKYMSKNIIEVAPLAYMRGRTLHDSFIILDEAQNTTPQQMKMFLTRMGFGSKMVITGDITQIDLPYNSVSGLKQAQTILKNVEGIQIITFHEQDVVRHEIVNRIIRAYDKYEKGEGIS
ncbi:PhoH family protein [Propionispora sp. 2/2-37]|uniref:PhoH family protein n=1 Tax=Propionispora sp. 2/2-37 TaxID=1677858 RepID=UPI0006BB983A|nr:PhoH family protein [Propionispora sp. 2/2-37]